MRKLRSYFVPTPVRTGPMSAPSLPTLWHLMQARFSALEELLAVVGVAGVGLGERGEGLGGELLRVELPELAGAVFLGDVLGVDALELADGLGAERVGVEAGFDERQGLLAGSIAMARRASERRPPSGLEMPSR